MQNKSINRFVLGWLGFSSLREMPERLLNVLSINNLKFWYCLGFRASDLGFLTGGVLAFRPVGPTLQGVAPTGRRPARRARKT